MESDGVVRPGIRRVGHQKVIAVLRSMRRLGRIGREGLIDSVRHARYSAPGEDETSQRKLTSETHLTKDYHRIEKGLSLAEPRRPFGTAVLERLEMGISEVNSDIDPSLRSYCSSALEALEDWNSLSRISDLIAPKPGYLGPTEWSKEFSQSGSLESFFYSRRSVRNFQTNVSVPLDDIRESVKWAGTAPSVCNRQAWRVHLFTSSDKVQEVLEHQNGNRGFNETIPAVAIISVRADLFAESGERNQRWVDGGLFAMAFAYALHAHDLATCFLNWSMNNKETRQLRKIADIAEREDIVTMIAIGRAAPEHRVARSPRRPLGELLEEH